MAGRRDAIKMSDDEIRAFLDRPHTLQVATINADGTPHLVAMWYTLIDGDVAFWTYAKSQKVVNLRRDPRITCMVEEGNGYDQLLGVQIAGRAEIVDDRETVHRIGIDLMYRYQGFEGEVSDVARAAVAQMGAKRCGVIVRAEHIVSWDHSKLGGGY